MNAQQPTVLPESADGSAIPARWRILGWLVFTTALALCGVFVTVTSTLSAGVARDANADVTQDLVEFTHFAAEATDPNTGQGFETFERLSEVFLRRQSPRIGQVLIAQDSGGRSIAQRVGRRVDPTFDSADAPALLAAVTKANSGILDTVHGELRWAKTQVQLGSGEIGQMVIGVFTQPRHDQLRNVRTIILNVSIAALVVVAVIGWLVAGQILRPLRVMRDVTASVSKSNLQRRIPVHGRDDVAMLAATVNGMLDRLSDGFAAEQRFVNDASRELADPIMRLDGCVNRLAAGQSSPREAAAEAKDEISSLQRVLADLRALVEAQRPGFVVPRRVEVQDFAGQLAQRASRVTERECIVRSARGSADFDSERLTSAMLQLIKNADTHADQGSPIRIFAEFVTEGERPFVRMSIVDDGPGINAEDAERFFDPFVHGQDASGVGLGLAIVRAIAEAHDGCAFVESSEAGATFGILIPRYRDDVEDDDGEEATS
ncbi:MAG: HAMP domain-containing sensor histidine kinase [Propionibacteriaceae bacterium]|nr:HAMP domain-containing sensor histidine kinase [Propionibacteriaceae bacterium]